jgi:hypothetical protein
VSGTYRYGTHGPWYCDDDGASAGGTPVLCDGSNFNGNFRTGNPTVDGAAPTIVYRRHRPHPGMVSHKDDTRLHRNRMVN